MTIDALDADKDIYLEKPITRYLDESFAVYNAAMKSKSIIQVGSQWTSEERWRKAAELVKEGGLANWFGLKRVTAATSKAVNGTI